LKEAVKGKALKNRFHQILGSKKPRVKGKAELPQKGKDQGPRKGKKGNSPKLFPVQKSYSQPSPEHHHQEIFTVDPQGGEPFAKGKNRRKKGMKKDAPQSKQKEEAIEKPHPETREPPMPQHQSCQNGKDLHVSSGQPELGHHERPLQGEKTQPLPGQKPEKIKRSRQKIGIAKEKKHGISGTAIGSGGKTVDAPGHHHGPSLHHRAPQKKIVLSQSVEKERKSQDFQPQLG
jgi:hypothetical protein